MTTGSNTLPVQPNAASIQKDIIAAKTCHSASKGKAAEAAAHIYLVWRATLAPHAELRSRRWLEDLFNKRNEEIDRLNKDIAEGNKKLTQDLRKKRLLRIEAKDNANEYTAIVRYILDLREARDASLVSRYATVVRWISNRFKDEVISSTTEITDAIADSGGFEAVIADARGNGSAPSGDTSKDDKELEKSILESVEASAATATTVGSFTDSSDESDGLLMALARRKSGAVEIVSTAPLPSDGREQFLRIFMKDLGETPPHNTRFVGTVVDLADLVEEGRVTQLKENGLAAGRYLREERMLTLHNTTLIVSARHADSCVVVEAEPNTSVALGKADVPLILQPGEWSLIASALKNKIVRARVTIEATQANDKLPCWSIHRNKHAEQVGWRLAVSEHHKPLTHAFNAACEVELGRSELERLLDRLRIWEKDERSRKAANSNSSKADKTKKAISLTFVQDVLRYELEGDTSEDFVIKGAVGTTIPLRFHPRDLLALMKRVAEQSAPTLRIAADPGGAIRASWSDDVGTYRIYQPALNAKGMQSERCFVPLSCPTTQAA